jgi:hypothetical protein
MVRIELGFEANEFERPIIEQTKEDIRQRLDGQLLDNIKIVLKKRPGNAIALEFAGDPDSVERAKRLLGID